MSLFKQCVAIFFLGLITDLTQTIHIQACATRSLLSAVGTIVIIYMTGFFGHNWFVEHNSAWPRWWITVSAALGAGVGTAAVILFGD